jgi:type VI protein secretion system component VasK
MELQKLQALLNSGLKPIVGELLEQKTQATEKVMVQQINSLNKFIQEGIIYCSQKVDELAPINVDSEMLNNLFRKYIA